MKKYFIKLLNNFSSISSLLKLGIFLFHTVWDITEWVVFWPSAINKILPKSNKRFDSLLFGPKKTTK